jgi:hypothetical protein
VNPKLIIDVAVRTQAIRVRSWASHVLLIASSVFSGFDASLVTSYLRSDLTSGETADAITLTWIGVQGYSTINLRTWTFLISEEGSCFQSAIPVPSSNISELG